MGCNVNDKQIWEKGKRVFSMVFLFLQLGLKLFPNKKNFFNHFSNLPFNPKLLTTPLMG